MPSNIRAGRITGSPTAGLCRRVCIEVKRVFDGCRENFSNQNYVTQITAPPAAVPPFTFVSAVNFGTAALNVVSLEPRNGRTRITADVTVPLLITFSDSQNNAYTATGQISLRRQFTLTLPQNAVTPYSLEVFAAFESRIGSFLSPDAVSVTGCLILIYKVIVITDILVPTYGNCEYPECCGATDICDVFLSRELFP